MFAEGPSNFETDEARAIRDSYNAKNGSTMPSADAQHLFLPCPAGVIWVDLTEFGGGDAGSGGAHQSFLSSVAPAVADTRGGSGAERRLSIRTSHANWEKARFGTTMMTKLSAMRRDMMQGDGGTGGRPGTRFLGRRRRSNPSQDSTSSSSDSVPELASKGILAGSDGDGRVRSAEPILEEEEMMIELLNFQLPPQRGAEEAKANATLSAKRCESNVEQEMAVRQMWRIAMGNAPGLKAEIAKLHATERAKLAMREYENEARRLKLAKNGAAPISESGAHGAPDSTGATRDDKSSPSVSPSMLRDEGASSPPADDARSVRARSASPTADGATTSPHARSRGAPRVRKGEAGGGVFGWLFNRRSIAASKEIVYDLSNSQRMTRASHSRYVA